MSSKALVRGSECNCSALRQAARVVTRVYDEALAPLGLGSSQYAILVTLERGGPQILGDLAAALVMDRSTVGHLLRPLEQRGLLTIGSAAGDARKRQVALSQSGRELSAAAQCRWATAQSCFEQRFGAEEAAAMRSILARVVAAGIPRAAADEREFQS